MRKKDFDKLYIPEKTDFEELVKSLYGQGDKENLHYKYRFLNSDYTKDLYRSYSQEVVLKIRTRGTGKRHLSILIDYLSRDLASQKNKERCNLYDHENNLIEPDSFDQIVNNWSNDFEPEIKEENPLLAEAFVELNKLEVSLENKYYDSSLTQEEGEVYNHIKNLKENNYDKSKIKDNKTQEAKIGQFCYHEETKKYGIAIRQPRSKNAVLVSTDSEFNLVKTPVKSKEEVQYLNEDMKKSLSSKPKDFSHIILSAGGDNPNPKLVEMATTQFLKEDFKAKGFEYIYTTHNDTNNLHTHIIVNNYSKHNGLKFSVNKFELQELRLNYKNKLDDLGINRTVTFKMDRENYLQTLKNDAQNMLHVKSPSLKNKLENIENHNTDILKFRKNGTAQMEKLSNQLFHQGEHKLATRLLEEKESYRFVESEKISEVVARTVEIIEKEAPQIAHITKKNLSKRLGRPSEYKIEKNEEIKEEILENYKNHLEKTKENLEELYSHPKMTPELEKQQDKAIEYLDKRIHDVSKVMGIEQEDGMSRGR